MLVVDSLTKTFPRAGTIVDRVDLSVGRGEFFTLLGPSGCGKTTLLRMIAGFERPSAGRIAFDGEDLTDVPPNRRRLGFVFQSYALFPHRSVAGNVAFGLEVKGVPHDEIRRSVGAMLEQLQLIDIADERVDRLSGGQQQRVALARALVTRPALLLLDEPLSSLDARLREAMRGLLRSAHRAAGVTTIFVTHDQAEAMSLSDRIAVFQRGRVEQVDTPQRIYERPATRFVAQFIGRNNVLEAHVSACSERGIVVRLADGTPLTVDSRYQRDAQLSCGMPVAVCIRADSLRAAADGAFAGTVAESEYAGSSFSFVVETHVGALRVEAPFHAVRRPSPGECIRLAVADGAAHVLR